MTDKDMIQATYTVNGVVYGIGFRRLILDAKALTLETVWCTASALQFLTDNKQSGPFTWHPYRILGNGEAIKLPSLTMTDVVFAKPVESSEQGATTVVIDKLVSSSFGKITCGDS